MTPQEAAAWIRLALRAFEAQPEKWGRGSYLWLCRPMAGRMCAIGGAACLSLAKPSRTDTIRDRARDIEKALGLLTALRVEGASDGAADVPDMVRRVEAVLREAGL